MKITKLQKKANRAFEVHKELSGLRVSALLHFYRLGELVREVRDNRYWEVLGHESFNAYLTDPDVAIPVSTAYHAIGIVETFPKFKEIEGLTVRNTIAILPAIKNEKGERQEFIEMARTLSVGDLQYRLAGQNVVNKENTIELPKIYACNSCGKVKGLVWQDLCHCGLREESVKEISRLISKKYDE